MTEKKSNLTRKTDAMGTHGIWMLLLRFSIPTTIGTAAFTIYNIVDRIVIGRSSGMDAIAGISITFPLFMVCIAIGMMIGIGGCTRTSLRLGEGRHEDAERILGNVVALFVLCGLTMSVLGLIFLEPMMRLFGASDVTMPYARVYMRILLCFVATDFIAMGMNGMLRAEGSTTISMLTLVLGSLLNVVLDYLFIMVFDMGVAGAAWATGISKTASAAWILWHFCYSPRRSLTLHLKNMRIHREVTLSILQIGISPFILQFMSSVMAVLMNRTLLAYGGDDAVGAMGVIFGLFMLLMMPAMGLMQGGQPIIGYNYGARQFDRVKQALNASLTLAVAISLLGSCFFQIFPAFFITLFAKGNAHVIALASHGLRLFTMLFPLAAAQMIISNYFLASGRPKISILLNLMRQVLFFMTFLFVLPRLFGLTGIWLVAPASDVCALVVALYMMRREYHRLGAIQSDDPRKVIRL
ncbi:MAG: MATE family efflux transporter [Spartobacteria bacterium]|nr:MATE family efflux transporter [Spartobacteria bacterium]